MEKYYLYKATFKLKEPLPFLSKTKTFNMETWGRNEEEAKEAMYIEHPVLSEKNILVEFVLVQEMSLPIYLAYKAKKHNNSEKLYYKHKFDNLREDLKESFIEVFNGITLK